MRLMCTRIGLDSAIIGAFVLLFALGPVCGQERSRTDIETELGKRLLDGYSINALPIPEGGLQVEVSIALGQFVAISTALETIEFQGWWRLWWKDPRLSWDPEVEGISTLSFRSNEVWLPDLTVYEQITDFLSPALVSVEHDGSCFTSIPRRTKVGCPMIIASFPYDRQRCNFTVGSWSYDGSRLDVAPRKQDTSDLLSGGDLPERLPFDLEPYKGFQEFWLAAVKTVWKNTYYNCCPEPYPALLIEFDLHRSTQTYLSGMVVPLILVTCVGFFSLYMPAPPSGARPALSVTVMLTTATVYFVASRSTPQSNQSTSIGRIYIYSLSSSFLLVFLSIITTALNLVQTEDKAQAKHLIDFFNRYDDDGNGTLDKEEFDAALASLGLTQLERDKMAKFFISDDDPTINKEQWKAFSSITEKTDDDAVYHNGLVRSMVHKVMELKIKKSGRGLGKEHPFVRTQQKATAAAGGSPSDPPPKDRTLELSPEPPLAVPHASPQPAPPPTSYPPNGTVEWYGSDTMGPGGGGAGGYPVSYSIPGFSPDGVPPSVQWGHGVRFGGSGGGVQWASGTGFGQGDMSANGHGPGNGALLAGGVGPGLERTPSQGLEMPVLKGPSGNPSFKQVSKKMSRLLNQDVSEIPGPPRVGRELSALIDKWARRLMPLGFAIFLVFEFCGVISGGERLGELVRYKDEEGIVKTRVEFFDYRTTTEGRCFINFPKTRSAENVFDLAEKQCDAL